MKTPEEMVDFFRSMSSRKRRNPYWTFNEADISIECMYDGKRGLFVKPGQDVPSLALYNTIGTLKIVREFFRRFYESFRSEAQVLCVHSKDAQKLKNIGIPVLTENPFGPFEATVFVLPQDNHMGTSVISELFWQKYIVGQGIVPIARIHSHHVLDPYQSITDYSTLNSGTLEMVIGKIFDDPLYVCCWLDVPGTDTKAQTFVAKQCDASFDIRACRFHGQDSAWDDEPESKDESDKMEIRKEPEDRQE